MRDDTVGEGATDRSLFPSDPESSCPYGSSSKMSALVTNSLMEEYDQQQSDMMSARNDYGV